MRGLWRAGAVAFTMAGVMALGLTADWDGSIGPAVRSLPSGPVTFSPQAKARWVEWINAHRKLSLIHI